MSDWIKAFVRKDADGTKYPGMAQPFLVDGLAVATDGKLLVATAAGAEPPAAPIGSNADKLAANTRIIITIPDRGESISRAALAAWAALPHLDPDCSQCKGTGRTSHECDCFLCEATEQPCDQCQLIHFGSILGTLIDRQNIARLLAVAPPADVLSVAVAEGRDKIPSRVVFWSPDWQAVIAKVDPASRMPATVPVFEVRPS